MNIDIPEAFDFLFAPKRYKAAFGGRGSAKSHSFATALLTLGGMHKLRILCAREIQKSIKDSVKQLLDDKIDALGMSSFYDSINNEIRGENGTNFLFAGLGDHTVDTIKSFEGIDIAWIEEAQTISARSMEILIPTIRKPKSELWFSWNPRHQSDPVDMRFRGVTPPDNAFIERVNYNQNPWFSNVLKDEMSYDRITNPDRFGHIWLGDYEPSVIGAIWNRQIIHDHRVDPDNMIDMSRIVVSIDPAVSSEELSNEHGIIVAGVGADGHGYILADYTIKGSPKTWAERAIAAYDFFEADVVVIEKNQGGDMCKYTLQTVRTGIPVVEVVATRGKHVRAEPISALYHLGQLHHAGSFPELEDQMCKMTAMGYEGEGSPDRCDAMVWAITELFPKIIRRTKRPAIRQRPKGWMG